MRASSAWLLLWLLSLLALGAALSHDLNLADALVNTTKSPATPKPKPTAGGGGKDLTQRDYFAPTIRPGLLPRTATKAPRSTRLPPRQPAGGLLTDNDLKDFDDYNPDKGKGGRGDPSTDDDYGTLAETGTIAGIVSAVAMAFIGAVTSYISYHKKKLCFSIQQSLNAEVMKAELPEAVVSQEPQVQQTLLQHPNAEPPQE